MDKKKRNFPRPKITAIPVIEAIVLSAGISFIFYESLYAMVLFPVVLYINAIRYEAKQREKREADFMKEFRELMLSLSASLNTGYSVEHAFKEAEYELIALFGMEGDVLAGVREINHKVGLAVPIEKAFSEFARKHPFEEVVSFAEIFLFSKRLGGDYGKNIRSTAMKIDEKIQVKQEIESLTAEKRMELNVMTCMPVGILLYVRLTSYSFVSGMYHNLFGILVMTACLAVYVFAIWLGQKIIRIDV